MGSTKMYLTKSVAILWLIQASFGTVRGCGEDDSVKPDCRQRPIGTPAGVSFYMPHQFNCSRFWECGPDMVPCLFECPQIDEDESLYFNPDMLICDWPWNVDCTPPTSTFLLTTSFASTPATATSMPATTTTASMPPTTTKDTMPTTTETVATTTTSEPCSDGWTQYQSKCYRFFTDRLFWFDARDACENQNGILASIPDASTNSFVMDLIKDSTTSWVLIGGIKFGGRYMWIDGTPWEYENWANNHLDTEDRLNIYANDNFENGTASFWNDLPCNGESSNGFSGSRPYVCSRPLSSGPSPDTTTTSTAAPTTTTTSTTTTTTPTTTSTETPVCEDGWTQYESRCFRFYTNSLNWVNARHACEQESATLPSIPDASTNSFVVELIKDSPVSWVLIGGLKINGSFTWIDGTPWEYDHWASGRPDDNSGKDNCLNIFAKNSLQTLGLKS